VSATPRSASASPAPLAAGRPSRRRRCLAHPAAVTAPSIPPRPALSRRQLLRRPGRTLPRAARAAPPPRRRLAPAAALPPPPPAGSSAAGSGSLAGSGSFDRAGSSRAARDTDGWKRRWTVVAMCFVAFMLCNMDRVNMSVAVLPMAASYGWSSATVGLVQSSFFWGYLLTQVAGGVWADRLGGKVVLGFGVVWWSLATVLTPFAAAAGLPALLAARACMGVGEGVAMPAMNNLLSKWVPVRERSRSLALVYSGMYTGSVLGLACSPHMIHALGWPSVFYIFGALGVGWWAWWWRNAASSPAEDPAISEAERRYIARNTAPSRPLAAVPWRLLLSKPPVWALIVSHFCHNWGTFILLTWMPTYYNQVLGLDLKSSGLLSVLPWVTMAVAANVGGWIADSLVSRGWSVTHVRKIMQTVGFLGPAFFLTRLSAVHTPVGAVACMMAAQGLDAFSQSGLYSNHQVGLSGPGSVAV
jgi:ACS family sodium-dependent inorganic phosphate cotransporter